MKDLYTLGVDMDRRRGMDRGGKWDNGHRKRVSPIRDTLAYNVFIREFLVSGVVLSRCVGCVFPFYFLLFL